MAEPAVPDSRLLEYRTVLWMVLTLTWMPWIKFLSGRTCILLWILYGNMVDFSFIVSLYVSDLPNVTISNCSRLLIAASLSTVLVLRMVQ